MLNIVANPVFIEIGDRIRQKRKKVNMTQKELAENIGIADKHLSRLEMGLTNMKLETFFAIAMALGVSPNEISPTYLLQGKHKSPFLELESTFNRLNEKQQQIAFDTITALLNSIAKQNI